MKMPWGMKVTDKRVVDGEYVVTVRMTRLRVAWLKLKALARVRVRVHIDIGFKQP